MNAEQTSTVVPAEIHDTIGKLHDEIEKLQGELAQALEVWKTTLTAEKNQFEELLKHKELAWQEQEAQWASQSQVYEDRMEELKSEFKSRLDQSEKNAAHSLAELDDAWQQDKLEWVPSARDQWPEQRHELEDKVRQLESQIEDQDRVQAEERLRFQSHLRDIENRSHGQAGPTSSTVKALQGQLLEFQQSVASFQDRAAHSDELVIACIQALDYEISVLYDLVHHGALPGPGDESSRGLA